MIDTSNAFTKTLRMRLAGKGLETTITTIPNEIIRKYSKDAGLSIKEFIKRYRVEWLYGGVDNEVSVKFIKED
jgi:hypothetical protein